MRNLKDTFSWIFLWSDPCVYNTLLRPCARISYLIPQLLAILPSLLQFHLALCLVTISEFYPCNYYVTRFRHIPTLSNLLLTKAVSFSLLGLLCKSSQLSCFLCIFYEIKNCFAICLSWKALDSFECFQNRSLHWIVVISDLGTICNLGGSNNCSEDFWSV